MLGRFALFPKLAIGTFEELWTFCSCEQPSREKNYHSYNSFAIRYRRIEAFGSSGRTKKISYPFHNVHCPAPRLAPVYSSILTLDLFFHNIYLPVLSPRTATKATETALHIHTVSYALRWQCFLPENIITSTCLPIYKRHAERAVMEPFYERALERRN